MAIAPHRRRPAPRPAAAGALLLWGLLALPACAINPVTGERELVLMSESQEVRLGQEADGGIVERLGLYDDPELGPWAQELGGRMAAASHRPGLPWTFRVVDDESVNAFALPGGFVYLTRGILAHMNSEAEVAGVLGHEIGHITARHAVRQYTRAGLAQIGLGVGGLLVPAIRAHGGLIRAGLAPLFLKFSRDQERQADRLGVNYAVAAGYDPRPLADFFRTMERLGTAEGPRLPGWLSTHPSPADRVAAVAGMAAALVGDRVGLRVGREAFLRRLDGVVFGRDPRAGLVDGATFRHAGLRFELTFPEGWRVEHQGRTVASVAPARDAGILVAWEAHGGAPDLPRHARAVVAGRGGWGLVGRGLEVHGMPAYEARYRARASGLGEVEVSEVFVVSGELVYGIACFAPPARFPAHAHRFRRTQMSFRQLSEAEVAAARPDRIVVVEVDRAVALREFLAGRRLAVEPETVALINGIELDDRLAPGQLLKLVAPAA